MDKEYAAQRSDFSGWSPAVDRLLQSYGEKSAPQALLLSGPAGILKEELALFLARSFLCRSQGERPCGVCGICRRILAGAYPNVLRLAAAAREKSIKIDQLRELLQQLSLNPMETGQRFVIVAGIDCMTVQAQNALLKSLEEPDDATFFILTSSNEQAVLPTVLSRCRVQRLLPWPDEQVVRYFMRQGLPQEKCEALTALANGRPGKALLMDKDERFQAIKALAQDSFLRVRQQADIPGASFLLKDSKDNAGALLDLLEIEAQSALVAAVSGKENQSVWACATASSLKKLMEEIHKARRYLASNVSWQAIADRLLLMITKEIYSCRWS